MVATPGNAKVVLTWAAVAGATGYRIYRTSTGVFDAGVEHDQHDAYELESGERHHLLVHGQGYTNGGNGPVSSVVSATPMAPPAGLTAAFGDRQVTLNWQPSAGATSYTIYRKTGLETVYGELVSGRDCAAVRRCEPDQRAEVLLPRSRRGSGVAKRPVQYRVGDAAAAAAGAGAGRDRCSRQRARHADVERAVGCDQLQDLSQRDRRVRWRCDREHEQHDVQELLAHQRHDLLLPGGGPQHGRRWAAVRGGVGDARGSAPRTLEPRRGGRRQGRDAVVVGVGGCDKLQRVSRHVLDQAGSVPIAQGLADPAFVDNTVVNGPTYYYKVTATNAGGTEPALL